MLWRSSQDYFNTDVSLIIQLRDLELNLDWPIHGSVCKLIQCQCFILVAFNARSHHAQGLHNTLWVHHLCTLRRSVHTCRAATASIMSLIQSQLRDSFVNYDQKEQLRQQQLNHCWKIRPANLQVRHRLHHPHFQDLPGPIQHYHLPSSHLHDETSQNFHHTLAQDTKLTRFMSQINSNNNLAHDTEFMLFMSVRLLLVNLSPPDFCKLHSKLLRACSWTMSLGGL